MRSRFGRDRRGHLHRLRRRRRRWDYKQIGYNVRTPFTKPSMYPRGVVQYWQTDVCSSPFAGVLAKHNLGENMLGADINYYRDFSLMHVDKNNCICVFYQIVQYNRSFHLP